MNANKGIVQDAPVALGAVPLQAAAGFCTDSRHVLPCFLPCEACAAECAVEDGVTVTMTIGAALLRSPRRIALASALAR
jgi:hypothetical protein